MCVCVCVCRERERERGKGDSASYATIPGSILGRVEILNFALDWNCEGVKP